MNTTPTVTVVTVPKTSANDDVLQVVQIIAKTGDTVAPGQPLLEIEGSKAVVEVEASAAGIVHILVDAGQKLALGAPLAVISDVALNADHIAGIVAQASETPARQSNVEGGIRFTQGAQQLMHDAGLTADDFKGQTIVTAHTVKAVISRRSEPATWVPSSPDRGGSGRVVLVGAGRGAHQVLSILLFQAGTQCVGILDDDPANHGRHIKGVRVLGRVSLLEEMKANGEVDAVICAVSSSIAFRRRVREYTHSLGLKLASAIHTTAVFDDGAKLGDGCYVGPFCYIGADTVIGENCFLTSRTTFEHHNVVGSEVTTGPNVATSGSCTIGDGVKFAAGIVVQNRLLIGDGAIIASGAVITQNVPARSIVKVHLSQRVREPDTDAAKY